MKATFFRIKNTLLHPQFSPQNAENRILLGFEISKFSGEARPLGKGD